MSSLIKTYASLAEALNPRVLSDFTKAKSGNTKVSRDEASQLAFYKTVMTLSNMHSAVGDMYTAAGSDSLARFHYDLSTKFRSEANKLKMKVGSK